MYPVPVTYLYDFAHSDEQTRYQVMQEFAANGAEHLVLTDTLLEQMLAKRSLADVLRKQMADASLTFMDSHAPFGKYLDLCCPVPEARAEMICRLKTVLYMIHSMNVNTITIHTGNEVHYPEYPLEVQFDCIKRSLDELLPLAEELGIVICIENIWFQINTPDRLLKVKESFPTEALGFCYDAGHANLMKNAPAHPEDSAPRRAWGDLTPAWDDNILEKMLPHIVNCHLHDNDGLIDHHWNVGDGTVNWNKTLSLLKQAPRLQVIQSEVIPAQNGVPIRKLLEACACFRA